MLASASGCTALKELLREPGNEEDHDAGVDEAVTPDFVEPSVGTQPDVLTISIINIRRYLRLAISPLRIYFCFCVLLFLSLNRYQVMSTFAKKLSVPAFANHFANPVLIQRKWHPTGSSAYQCPHEERQHLRYLSKHRNGSTHSRAI